MPKSSYKNTGTDSSVFYALGFSYLKIGSLTEAFNSFAASDVTDDTLYLMADIAQRMGEKKAEVECYKTLLAIYPKSKLREEVLGRLGLSLIDEGRIQEAEDVCQKMKKDYPEGSYTLQLLHRIGNIHK